MVPKVIPEEQDQRDGHSEEDDEDDLHSGPLQTELSVGEAHRGNGTSS
jgi:hypothetical protein